MSTQGERGQAGLSLDRLLTTDGQDRKDGVQWASVDAKVYRTGDDEKDIIKVEAPSHWSQGAINVVAAKYLKRGAAINGGAGETSIRALLTRVCDTIADQGIKQGYFQDEDSAKVFRDELCHVLLHQLGAFNSPVYFNCGVMEAYGFSGSNVMNYFWDPKTGKPIETQDYYSHPQLSACFILSIKDDLKDIWEHVGREMKIFKGGSGVGVSFSTLRSEGEPLSPGGTSSGVISFLEIFDKAAGSTKSGGTSRRAAKMAILDASHPEIMEFIRWKAREEEKAKMLIVAGLPSDFNGEAYHTVSGQNSNNTVRLTDEFMDTLMRGGTWDLKAITTGEIVRTVKAEDLFREICEAAWKCADPGLQFDTTINSWNTCPKNGRINASNPCGEYFGIDDSACNLASINLVKLMLPDGSFDVTTFRHVCRLFTVAQDIIIDYASYPTEQICRNSHTLRAIGLGYSNLGSLLMRMALPYDSDRGRSIASTITAIMTAAAYGMSAEMAEVLGPFQAFKQNRTPMLEVMAKHARKATNPTYEKMCPEYLMDAASKMWEETMSLGKKFGFRNSQSTLAAPTGTISFMLDCDTTGIEPEFALVKEKLYAGGGRDRLVNQSVETALQTLGYSPEQIGDIISHISGTGSIRKYGDSGVCERRLLSLGFSEEIISRVNEKIRSSRTIGDAISQVQDAMVIVRDVQSRFSVDAEEYDDPLERMGFSKDDVEEANIHTCGNMGIESAPHIRSEHLPIFDCASICGIDGKRFIRSEGHVKMMAAIQPFLSGGISKTVNLPFDATSQDLWDIFISAWQQGLKGITIYRDGCKGSQPLTAGGKSEEEEDSSAPIIRRKRPPKLMQTGARRCVSLNGYTIYVHAYRDEDTGKINEIWIDTKPGGGILDGFLNSLARLVSTALQYGIPMEEIVKKFAYTSFDPCGPANHPKIKQCRSIIDLVFRTIAVDFLGDDSYADGQFSEQTPISQPQMQQFDMHQGHMEVIICSNCGSDRVQKTGTCYTCTMCGTTTGCA